MPNPSKVLAKRAPVPGASILADLGGSGGEAPVQSPVVPQPVPLAVRPAPEPARIEAPIMAEAGEGDRAAVKALVQASIKANPGLALVVRSKGPVARERISAVFDPETLDRFRNHALDKGKSTSILLSDDIFPWAKANADRTSLIWAKAQLASKRKVAQRHMKAAKAGVVEEFEPGTAPPETLNYPLAVFSRLQELWRASGLKKKGFIEACVYLFLEIHAPRRK